MRSRTLLTTLALLATATTAAWSAVAQGDAADVPPAPAAITASDPLIAHTLYTWYRPSSFDKAPVQPLERFSSDDVDHYRRYFSRLRANGVDVIAGVMTGRPGEKDAAGKPLHTNWESENLLRVIPVVGASGMKFMIYYDTGIRSWWKNRIERGDIRITDPRFRRQVLSDFAWIADEVINRHPDDVLFLQTTAGRRVLDEKGLPRPVIAIYIARSIRDEPGYAALAKVMDGELARIFHDRGLGRPALVLDMVWWGAQAFDPAQAAAYGDNLAALTAFCPVTSAEKDITSLGDWVPRFADLYSRAANEAADLVGRGELPAGVQVWPGIMPNFEKGSNTRSRARDLSDWEAMLRMGVTSTRRVGSTDDADPVRSMLIVYSDEFFEGTSLLTDGGLYTLPLTVQGNVLKDMGVWLDRF